MNDESIELPEGWEWASISEIALVRTGVDHSYFWHWFQSIDLDQLSDGSNVLQINHGDMELLLVPIPPITEQKRIVAKIEELRSRTQKAREALEVIPEMCDRFRQSVLAIAILIDL